MKGRIIHGQFVWHRDKNYLMQILYLLPTIKVTKFSGDITYDEKGSWTIDVIWLKLYITFGYIIKKSND